MNLENENLENIEIQEVDNVDIIDLGIDMSELADPNEVAPEETAPEDGDTAAAKRNYFKPKEQSTAADTKTVAHATAESGIFALNFLTKNLCSALSGKHPSHYAMEEEEKKELTKITQIYFESTGNLPSPSAVFFTSILAFLAQKTIQVVKDRRELNEIIEKEQEPVKPTKKKTDPDLLQVYKSNEQAAAVLPKKILNKDGKPAAKRGRKPKTNI